jgi:hypothetical protein
MYDGIFYCVNIVNIHVYSSSVECCRLLGSKLVGLQVDEVQTQSRTLPKAIKGL